MPTRTRESLLVQLLGVPRLEVAGQPLQLPTKRALGIVAYLALEGETSREELAALLWDETWFPNPRRNLRQELYRLAQTPLAPFLDLEDTVRLRCTCDAKAALEGGAIGGELLMSFDLTQAPEFAAWLEDKRQTLAGLRLARLEQTASQQDGAAALGTWLEVLRLEPLRETALQTVLQLEAAHISKAAAKERYTDFCTLLFSEMGLQPLPETVALANQLGLSGAMPTSSPDTRLQRLLEPASLLEPPFMAQTLFDVTNLSDFEVLEVWETALSQGLLQPFETGFRVSTDIAVPPQRAALLERRLARRLAVLGAAPHKIAEHHARAGEKRLAAERFVQAAELARKQKQLLQALTFYDRALEQGVQNRFAILEARIYLCQYDQRVWREAVRLLEQESRSLGANERAIADLQRALWHLAAAEYPKVQEFVAPHLEKSGKLGAMAAYLAGTALVKTGQLGAAEAHLQRALETKNALEDKQRAEVHNVLCVLNVQRNNTATAKLHNQAALKGFARSGENIGLSRALSTAGVLELLTQQYRPAERMFAKALGMAVQIGDITNQTAILLNLSKAKFETFRYASAHADLLRGLALLEQHPDANVQGSYLVNLAGIERVQLKLDAAWERLEQALQLAQSQGAAPKIAQRSLILADMALERGRLDTAKHHLELAKNHLTPELENEYRLQQANLAWCEQQPARVLEVLHDGAFSGDALEFASALRGFAALEMGAPDASVLAVTTTGIYSPLLQAAQIRTRAALGSLQPSHLETRPLEQVIPYMRLALLESLVAHHPQPKPFVVALKKVQFALSSGSCSF
jgi:DNA-binding SARP family transcriptional activator